jgi:hypothetical protein
MEKRVEASGQRGQVVAMVVLAITVLLGAAALVVDVGTVLWARSNLQSSVDAAALAGAQALPSSDAAAAITHQYVMDNWPRGLKDLTENTTTSCLATAPGCNPVNALQIKATAHVDLTFSRIFGIDSVDLTAKATACQPCGAKPMDVMIVLDRTGSMGTTVANGQTKIANARNGIMTFLGYFDPSATRVGLAVLPPAPNTTQTGRCGTPVTYSTSTNSYLLVPLSTDYKVNGVINNSSTLVSTISCVKVSGGTSYSLAIQAAQAELAAHGRANAQHIIVFLTDGSANQGPSYSPYSSSSNAERMQPCHSGVNSAAAAKAAGTTIYTIGYGVEPPTDAGCTRDQDDTGSISYTDSRCQQPYSTDNRWCVISESPSIRPIDALLAMASDPSEYYDQPSPTQLNTVFSQVAADISAGSSRLVD